MRFEIKFSVNVLLEHINILCRIMTDICKACGDLQSEVTENVVFHPFPVDIEK